MAPDIERYFGQVVLPVIVEAYPEVAASMSVIVGGSVGLGIDDEGSDLDARMYLDDELWRRQGGQVQLLLTHTIERFGRRDGGHPEICVHPASWLLDGQHKSFLGLDNNLPWEQVSLPSLFEFQKNLILYDPQRLLHKLRVATSPDRYPDSLWHKQLITRLDDLLNLDDLGEFARVVEQGKWLEAAIILGWALQGLLELGFVMHKRYFPYRKHLSWAFAQLPIAAVVQSPLKTISHSADWCEKAATLQRIKDSYKTYMVQSGILSHAMLADHSWGAGEKLG